MTLVQDILSAAPIVVVAAVVVFVIAVLESAVYLWLAGLPVGRGIATTVGATVVGGIVAIGLVTLSVFLALGLACAAIASAP